MMRKLTTGLNALKAAVSVKLGRPVPLKVTHIVTHACNLRCKYCYAESFNKDKEMSTEQIKSMMNTFKKLGTKVWKIGGGEPLIRKDIDQIINHAKKLGFLINLDTNGTVTESKLHLLKGLNNVHISIDGPKEVHDGIRGKGVFDKCMHSLDLLKGIGLKPLVNCVISKRNIKHIDYMVNLARKKECYVNFQPVVPVTKEAKDELSKEMIDADIFNKIIKLKKENPFIANSDDSMKRFDQYYRGKIPRYQKDNCLAGQIYCIVSPLGNVSRCIPLLGKEYNNGLKLGFKKAFKNLSKSRKCDCTFCCFYDLTNFYSLNPLLTLKVGSNILRNRWIYN